MTHEQKALRFNRTSHPLLYEVNTRVLLTELAHGVGRKLTLDAIPDTILDEWESLGFDMVWLMGVWTTGRIGLEIARQDPQRLAEYRKALSDFELKDVIGSPYAVKAYTISSTLGGKEALVRLRRRLEKRGIGLVLDFVCNHTARDHRWVSESPGFYVQGKTGEHLSSPDRFFAAETVDGEKSIAFGKDPYFPGWTDTAQIQFRNSRARAALIRTLGNISGLCDGVRCDMAMLALNSVFDRTWGELARPAGTESASDEFWREAIDSVRSDRSGFRFIAEAYWNLEWELQQLGFDFTYDKVLCDRLLREGAGAVREHLGAEMEYQRHSVRFIENHDEPRAAQQLPSVSWHCAAAAIMATVPGMALFHDGQLQGRRVKLPVQLGRRPPEDVSERLFSFYRRLIPIVADSPIANGQWKVLNVRPAWFENPTWANILAFCWKGEENARLVIVNYAPRNSQCYVEMDCSGLQGPTIEFRDLMGPAVYVRERNALVSRGMYFDLPPYGLHVFDVRTACLRTPANSA